MQISDTREINVPPAIVYATLQDPEMLKACIAGAQEVTGTPQDGYTATVVQKIGPVKATFQGHVVMSEMVENKSMKLSGEGKGGVAGFAKGSAYVVLEPGPDNGTILKYEVEARVGGKLAQLGSRLIDGFARNMADQFFVRLKEGLEGPSEGAEMENTSSEDASKDPKKKTWLKRVTGRE